MRKRIPWHGERDERGRPIVRCVECGKARKYAAAQARKYEGTICGPCQWERNRANRACKKCGVTESKQWFGFVCYRCTMDRQNEWRRKSIGAGSRCAECANPPEPGKVTCAHHSELKRQRQREARAADPDGFRARNRSWNARNIEKVRAQKRRFYAANKYIFFENARKRRARKLNAAGSGLSNYDWQQIVDSQDSRCIDCGVESQNLTVGHLVPLSRGGTHDKSNIVAQCLSCNLRQAVKIHPLAFSLVRIVKAPK